MHATVPFSSQASALVRKSYTVQRRNWSSNVALLSSPIFFCVILFLLQYLVNNILFAGRAYKCGCQCLECCSKDHSNCTKLEQGYCDDPLKCYQFNDHNCSVAFSSVTQSLWCPIEFPSAQPPIMQIPEVNNRAQMWKPRVAFLTTGSNISAPNGIAENLIPPLRLTTTQLRASQRYYDNFQQTLGKQSSYLIVGELFGLLGIQLGTFLNASVNLYIENAVFNDNLEAIVTMEFCKNALDLDGDEVYNISLVEFLEKGINASNPPSVVSYLNRTYTEYLASGGSASSSFAEGLRVNCTEAVSVSSTTKQEMLDLLYCGYRQARCNGKDDVGEFPAGFDFKNTSETGLSVDIYYNDTFAAVLGVEGPPTVPQRIPAFLNQAVNAWITSFLDTSALTRTDLVGVMAMPKLSSKLILDFSSLLGPLFYAWVVQMLLPVYLMQLVYEKEKRLRMMMKMHGLGDGSYWMVTYSWFFILYLVYIIIFVAIGSAINLNIFRKNSYGIQAIFYILFGLNMVAFSFVMSSLFKSSKTAAVFANLWVFGTGLVGYLLLQQLFDRPRVYNIILELIPSFALYRGLFELGEYAFLGTYRNSPGMQFVNLGDHGNGMIAVWIILIVETAVFLLLGWYLEQVVSNGTGIQRPPLYFLDYILKATGRHGRNKTGTRLDETTDAFHSIDVRDGMDNNQDIQMERRRIASLEKADMNPIVVKDLRKVFTGGALEPRKVAVRNFSLGIESGECFGLLGPNGAGKSTCINMMVGFITPTSGTAIICGIDIRQSMNEIYSKMGVCPQDDLLWESLTAREHLLFYGRLKGLSGLALSSAVEKSLKEFNLWKYGTKDKQIRQFSGGMKRRLSVAISFIGDPKVIYLDEPSTGLDPASRRNLWQVIKKCKAGRAIVLTSHSMEEVETLCERIGIFVDGQLICLGVPKEIKAKHGDYLVFTITAPSLLPNEVHELVMKICPKARNTYALAGTFKYEIPKDEVTLVDIYRQMQEMSKHTEVTDWGVANASLEEVFITLASKSNANNRLGHCNSQVGSRT